MIEKIAKPVLRVVTGNRKSHYNEVKKVAAKSEGRTVLEVGSGKQVEGWYPYSARHLFPADSQFIMTDINPEFGHEVLDIALMQDEARYDIVLCLSVLEHVYEFQKAVDNIHRSLRDGGILCVAVPFAYPLHDEPDDYWRFTEHALRKMMSNFAQVDIKHQRARRLPTSYFVQAVR